MTKRRKVKKKIAKPSAPKAKPAHPRPAPTKAEQAAFKRADRHVSKPMPKKH
jgi:hypothetical protein